MTRHDLTDAHIDAMMSEARRLRAVAFRDAGRGLLAWLRGLLAGASAPKAGRTA